MIAAARTPTSLVDRLPEVRGRYREHVSLANVTWFQVGGPADVVFRPADREDLANFLRAKPADVPVTVIGVGSNLLVRDGGIPGVVVRLGRAFARIALDDDGVVAGAAALDTNVARFAAEADLSGLEFLAGIPGTIGGALRMNGGAYGREMRNVVREARAVAPDGTIHNLDRAELGFSYRRSAVPEDWIFTGCRLRAEPGDHEAIAARMAEIHAARSDTQPVRTQTGGSTFKNPDGKKAWEIIDAAGCRGLAIGGARVSELHCNFLVNEGDATAADIEALGEEVRRRVKEATGVTLEWEIRRVGVPAHGAKAVESPEASP
jgi:UDP-N-acetylmuramate dehydrogenase